MFNLFFVPLKIISFHALQNEHKKLQTSVLKSNHFAHQYLLLRSFLDMNVVFKTGPFFILPVFKEYIKRKVKLEDKVALVPSDHFSPLLDPKLFKVFNGNCPQANSPPCKEWWGQGRKQNETNEIIARKSFLVHRFTHIGYMQNKTFKTVDVCNTDLEIARFYGNRTV